MALLWQQVRCCDPGLTDQPTGPLSCQCPYVCSHQSRVGWSVEESDHGQVPLNNGFCLQNIVEETKHPPGHAEIPHWGGVIRGGRWGHSHCLAWEWSHPPLWKQMSVVPQRKNWARRSKFPMSDMRHAMPFELCVIKFKLDMGDTRCVTKVQWWFCQGGSR